MSAPKPYVSDKKSATPIIEAKGISHHFGGNKVLCHVDIALYAGEILTIIGPNGGGKSTLLRLMLGLLPLQEGVVTRTQGIKVGYVPQKMHIDSVLPLTVLRFLHLTPKLNHERLMQIAKEVGIEDVLFRQMADISGGQFQRVLLANALLQEPDVLVLDEPLQGMDIHAQANFYALLRKIRDKRHCAIVMVSHDLHTVMQATDKVLCLNQHICCSGKPEDVSKHPEYQQLFGAKEAEAIAVYTHEHDHEH
jgi:zinc transport system ATP-binding protein